MSNFKEKKIKKRSLKSKRYPPESKKKHQKILREKLIEMRGKTISGHFYGPIRWFPE